MILKTKEECELPLLFDNTRTNNFLQCNRFDFFCNVQGIKRKSPSPPLDFGDKLHRALEHWYKTNDREASLKVFADSMEDIDYVDEKRNRSRGLIILEDYFERYPVEQFVPIINGESHQAELTFAIPLGPEVPGVMATGKIDLIMRQPGLGICAVDHKTTSEMGEGFWRMIKPNRQFSCYIWAARQYFENVYGLMVNAIFVGIQTKLKKAEQEAYDRAMDPETGFMFGGEQAAKEILASHRNTRFGREWTTRTDDELEWWRQDTIGYVKKIHRAYEKWDWPQNTNSCNYYGACPYYELCSTPRHFTEIEPSDDRYEINVWNPLEAK